ncbi:uncharacterized protein LOC113333607 [Papaver somniferum]|uniref:uncharacterized protein LOC113333607 n=1 Tax=Papaver somniferum TaxID=3469 RepID=UPI000E703B68|nr:uncharacterized protein LOC113333607 [Papaver somniferum]
MAVENWRCQALPREGSDHSTLLGFPFSVSRTKRAPFGIQKMWFLHTDFLRMVSDSWNMPVHGSLDFIFTYKLKRLKGVIKEWNLAVFANIHSRLKQDQLRLSETRLQHNTMPNQKARKQWLVEGSSNTTFFHNSIRIRRSSNTISELTDSDGHTISDYDQLRDHVLQLYEEKFNGNESNLDASLFYYEHVGISEEESLAMDKIPTPDEIKQAIPNGVNSSLIIVLPKVRGANTLRNFRPIGLSKFFFKIFTKILATKLGSVLDKLVSEEQVAFMKGRNIHENISLASEMVNELHIKRKDGNIGLNIDISQAFDMSLNNLVDLLGKYQRDSGQTVCRQKIKIYHGGCSLTRMNYLANHLGMTVATFTDRYLGVKIMSCTVRYHHISGVVEKIKSQLASWKGFLLSFHDHLVLVTSVIANYSIHNMDIYKWPRKFILQCERAIRNFIWPGDSNVSHVVVVAYDKVCFPFEEGGLGLTRMATMNDAMLMKLWWKIRSSKKKWAGFLRAKFFGRNGYIKVNGLKSSILQDIRRVYKLVEYNTKVLLGDGINTSLYYDAWFSNNSIAAILNGYTLDRNVLVSTILVDGPWNIPVENLDHMAAAGLDINLLPTPTVGKDVRIWMPDYKVAFTVSSAKELIRQKYPKFDGASILWRKEVHPTLAA